jgi:hypothetical protein
MKIEIARYVGKCDTCICVKAIHMRTAGPLQSLSIPTWKWEDISMDFIVGLPRTAKGYDSIWVIVDRLAKIAHFLLVKTDHPVVVYAQLYIARILSLHGVPKTIVSDRGPQFVAKFWEALHKSLGTKLLHSSAYHPQTSGQTERVNQILHKSQLKKCLRVPDRTVEVTDVALEPDLTYSEHPIRVLDQKDRITRRRTLKFYKIQWNQHTKDEATWETQDFLDKNFPGFLASCKL